MQNYRWATLGCGVIANELAQALASRGQTLYSVANRTHAKAAAFAEKYGIEKVYDQIDDVFADPDVDIIYISTPHNTHIQYLRKALAAGKHVLCEKSITLNSDELDEAIRLAEEHHVVLAEAMTLYHMPIYRKLQEKLDTGALGELRLIQMNFGSYKPYDMSNRFFNRNLAGGALLDIGVYALSFVRWFMTSAPDEVVSQVRFAPTGVDEQAGILLKNKEQEMASVILSLHAKQPKRGTVAFDKGYVEFYDYPRGQEAVITYTEDGSKETLRGGSTADALPTYVLPKNVELMMKHGVYTKEEMLSRHEIHMEKYRKVIHIEAATMVDMVQHEILNAASEYESKLCETMLRKHEAAPELPCHVEKSLANSIGILNDKLLEQTVTLKTALETAPVGASGEEEMRYYHDVVAADMDAVRDTVDRLETLTAGKYWPYPTFYDLLFSV